MSNFASYTRTFVAASMFWMAALLPACADAAKLKLALVLSEQGGAYGEFQRAFESALRDKEVSLLVTGAEGPLPDSDLVVAAGMKAATAVAAAMPPAMLAVLVPREGVDRLMKQFPALDKAGAHAFSAIYLDQPLKRQLDLIAAILPQARSVGVLFAEPPKELAALRNIMPGRKLQLHERATANYPSLHAALQSLLLSSDVLLALPDAEIYNAASIRNILLTTYRNKVPLVGFSAAYVKAGALCAVFSTPAQIAGQAGEVVREYTESRMLPAPQHAQDFEVLVNEQVAHSLGLNIRSASQVRSEIRAAP